MWVFTMMCWGKYSVYIGNIYRFTLATLIFQTHVGGVYDFVNWWGVGLGGRNEDYIAI